MLLPNFDASEFKFCGRAETVGKQPGVIKQQSNSASFATTDYSNRCIKKGMGSILQGSASGGQWHKQESVMHINILDLKAVHFVLLTFTKMFQNKSIHVQMYDMVALTFVVKIGVNTSQEITNLEK